MAQQHPKSKQVVLHTSIWVSVLNWIQWLRILHFCVLETDIFKTLQVIFHSLPTEHQKMPTFQKQLHHSPTHVLQVHLSVLCCLGPKEVLAMGFSAPSSHWSLPPPLQLGPTALMVNSRPSQSWNMPTFLSLLQPHYTDLPSVPNTLSARNALPFPLI